MPSATFHASAKSLARLAAMMANQGQSLEEEGGNDLMEKSTWEKMHAEEKTAYDAAMYSKLYIGIISSFLILKIEINPDVL